MSKFSFCSIETKHEVRIDLAVAYPHSNFPDEVLTYEDRNSDVYEFTTWDSTPANKPFITFWCEVKSQARHHADKIQKMIEEAVYPAAPLLGAISANRTARR